MDNKSKDDRSRNMRAIKNKDTKIEKTLRSALYKRGIRYRKNYAQIPGKPDIAITKYKIAVFCDSEFFHGKDWETLKKQLERSNNSEFWIKKIESNRTRDYEIDQKLIVLGWSVIRFWGKDILKNPEECVRTIEEKIEDIRKERLSLRPGIEKGYFDKVELHSFRLEADKVDQNMGCSIADLSDEILPIHSKQSMKFT